MFQKLFVLQTRIFFGGKNVDLEPNPALDPPDGKII